MMAKLQGSAMSEAGVARVLPLEGGTNFRDIGGYPAADGRMVRRGMVYRSGSLSRLSDADLAYLAPLGVRMIVDLRADGERRHHQSRWPGGAKTWAREHESSAGDLWRELGNAQATTQSMRAAMLKAYHTLAQEQAPSYAALFRHIAAGELPLVFHCAAGKDRTGIAAALLLSLLGVARETVIEDYMLTAAHTEQIMQVFLNDPKKALFTRVEPAVLRPLMSVEPAFLMAMFGALEREYGTVEVFIRDVLGVDAAMAEAIRERLLTSGR
jgi:protein-tyrosine phosphatase